MSAVAPQPTYRHTQTAPLTSAALGLGLIIVLVSFLRELGRDRARAASFVPGLGGLAFATYLVSSLSVEVDETEVVTSFAGGLFRHTVPLEQITAAEVVRTPWYAGWGLRLTRTGLLYCIWGRDAVELRLENGRTFTIGTDQPYLLRSAVTTAAAARRTAAA